MKIAIFENEYPSVEGAFNAANLIEFNNQLELKVFSSSQDAIFHELKEYDVIFVDIDLSAKSQLDGFGVIHKINELDNNLTNRVVILTGNSKIEEILSERGINRNGIQIIIKPTNFKEISNAIRKVK